MSQTISHLGVSEETQKMRSAVTFGNIGPETILAQLYPSSVSLFVSGIDPKVADIELSMFNKALEINGVTIISFRDALAECIRNDLPQSNSRNDVLTKLINEASDLRKRHRNNSIDLDYMVDCIESFYNRDCSLYGDEVASALNYYLSLENGIPLGNIIFSRDQSNVVFSARIISNMKKKIRTPEVKLYNMVYDSVLPHHRRIEVEENDFVEGGDIFVHDRVVYIGVGPRTTENAALTIFRCIYPLLCEYSYEFAVVCSYEKNVRQDSDELHFMHLDSWAIPLGRKQMLVLESEAVERTVCLLTMKNKEVHKHETGLSFLEFIQSREQRAYYVPPDEHEQLGCNILSIDENTVIIPNVLNTGTIEQIKIAGKTIIPTQLNEISKGYGAVHCLIAPLERSTT